MTYLKIKTRIKDYNFIRIFQLSRVREQPFSMIIQEAIRSFLEYNKENTFGFFKSYYKDSLFYREVEFKLPNNLLFDIDEICAKTGLSRTIIINTILGYYLHYRDTEINEYEDLWEKITIEKDGIVYDPKMFEGSS